MYVPFPLTGAVPTVVPPLVHVLGALAWGPKTLKVTVPPAPLTAPDSVELIEPAAIAVPGVPLAGALTLALVVALTAVEVMPVPQALDDARFVLSPL